MTGLTRLDGIVRRRTVHVHPCRNFAVCGQRRERTALSAGPPSRTGKALMQVLDWSKEPVAPMRRLPDKALRHVAVGDKP